MAELTPQQQRAAELSARNKGTRVSADPLARELLQNSLRSSEEITSLLDKTGEEQIKLANRISEFISFQVANPPASEEEREQRDRDFIESLGNLLDQEELELALNKIGIEIGNLADAQAAKEDEIKAGTTELIDKVRQSDFAKGLIDFFLPGMTRLFGVSGITRVTQGITAGFSSLVKFSDRFSGMVTRVAQSLSKIAGPLEPLVKKLGGLSRRIGLLAPLITIFDGITGAFAASKILGVADPNTIQRIMAGGLNALTGILSLFTDTLPSIFSKITGIGEELVTTQDELNALIVNSVKKMSSSISSFFTTLFDSPLKFVDDLTQKIKEFFTNLSLKDILTGGFSRFLDEVGDSPIGRALDIEQPPVNPTAGGDDLTLRGVERERDRFAAVNPGIPSVISIPSQQSDNRANRLHTLADPELMLINSLALEV